jgi:hypothetical protein
MMLEYTMTDPERRLQQAMSALADALTPERLSEVRTLSLLDEDEGGHPKLRHILGGSAFEIIWGGQYFGLLSEEWLLTGVAPDPWPPAWVTALDGSP